MQILASWATLIAMLILSVGNPAAASQSVQMSTPNVIDIYSVVACRDTTTVTVSGSSAYATNRVLASVSFLNSDGDYELLQQITSSNFGRGSFWIPLVFDYHTQPVDADTSLQIVVQLQRSSGGAFTNLGDPVTAYATAANRHCREQCPVIVSTSDRAPVNGVIALRSHFGSWFRPEGWLHGVASVYAGRAVHATFATVPCDAWARAWFYPASGADRTPRMLPSQFWPNEFGTGSAGDSAPYATSFARGLPAIRPLEPDDPYSPR